MPHFCRVWRWPVKKLTVVGVVLLCMALDGIVTMYGFMQFIQLPARALSPEVYSLHILVEFLVYFSFFHGTLVTHRAQVCES